MSLVFKQKINETVVLMFAAIRDADVASEATQVTK